ncbi:MAG TPA: CRISPR-associated RAMP protein Csx7 [Ktedonobacteraceae bacterium]|nr:CRISPR-associated RAMP protein Csx7 [Ktedonobacteraceae bacterium]
MTDNIPRYGLSNRYLFTGQLIMQTAFHIGGGKATLSNSDSPVVLTPEGAPFIPGSSFKGALRSTVEKLVASLPEELGLWSCGLQDLSESEIEAAQAEKIKLCPTVRQKEIAQRRRNSQGNDRKIVEEEREKLCTTCKLFGSPFEAAKLSINDLYLVENEWSDMIQRRDGVAIDRDSEKAKDRLKYDFEVVPASTTFKLQITLENASPHDLQLMSIGLSEFMHGFGFIGGKRSRGLGACLLDGVQVSYLDLTEDSGNNRSAQLHKYLLRKEFPHDIGGKQFLEEQMKKMFPDA